MISINKKDVANILQEMATIMELKGENPFRVRAYRSGARAIEIIKEDVRELVETGRLTEIKGIGKVLADNISELITTGKLVPYEEIKASIPPGLLDVLQIPGLGPKKVAQLYQALDITSIRELEYACKENRLLDLKGFGAKSQANILEGIEHLKRFQGHFNYAEALSEAKKIVRVLQNCPAIQNVQIAGSLRRFKEIIKDIDLVVVAEDKKAAMDCFLDMPQIQKIINHGPTKSSVTLETGINCDLRVVKPDQFFSAWHHFTGSKEHHSALRGHAKSLGLKINEYGIFQGENGDLIKVDDEESIYKVLGMQYIPPELRENRGEIEAALGNALPDLIEASDLQGIFHLHTNYSDGSNTITQLAEAAKKGGYKYIGISDHSQSAIYAHGLNLDRIKRQQEEIARYNSENPDFYVFSGIEADILNDGNLDYPDQILETFDFVIASIHSGFNITGRKATERLKKAMENPYVTMLGHPTGRILLGRGGYEPEMDQVIAFAKDRQVILEINASPYRLDTDWRYLKLIRETGGLVSINPDAHRIEELDNLFYGLQMARKGWLEKGDVFNTWPLKKVKNYFQKIKRGEIK